MPSSLPNNRRQPDELPVPAKLLPFDTMWIAASWAHSERPAPYAAQFLSRNYKANQNALRSNRVQYLISDPRAVGNGPSPLECSGCRPREQFLPGSGSTAVRRPQAQAPSLRHLGRSRCLITLGNSAFVCRREEKIPLFQEWTVCQLLFAVLCFWHKSCLPKKCGGADPKSVVCAFFKQGQCTKGDKCKFSHDLSLERKCEKRSVYIDARDEDLEKDTMDNWDEKKLEEVVNKKHGEAEKKKPKTQIVCKYFLDAIENNKYGWFWVCPGGGDNCMYRHALPPGFVLKKDKKKEEKQDEISLEDLIEKERAALGPNVTKITLECFIAWKRRKRQEKIDKAEQDMERRKADFKAGKALVISGREVFEFRPELVDADDEEADDTRYTQGTGEDDEVEDPVCVNDVDLSLYVPKAVDETGITVASPERFSTYASIEKDDNKLSEASGGEINNSERNDLEEDRDGDEELENGVIDAVPVDENLFTGEDLDELEEELNTLDLEE
ncbi:zinc finger CCCH domain-containing protein 15 [Meleagris gallopavo]|uniref:zinc finger CCCH domain-containing protein 15 n=1 Tax=Meleagris gallopavo TaxID=9103 RepID=UPI0012ABCB72|nr:zinc finger CCCH domain-containing protein 15 [Meleagris gallopavo]